MRPILALSLLTATLLAGAAWAQDEDGGKRLVICDTLPECLAEVRDPDLALMTYPNNMRERILPFGDAAVDGLVPMLRDPDPMIRWNAASMLSQFRTIDRRHLPALVEAWHAGDAASRFMPRPIAATGTEEAVELLWQGYLRNRDAAGLLDYVWAIEMLGVERLRPELLGEFGRCRASANGAECQLLGELLRSLEPPQPEWFTDALADLAGKATSARIRASGERQLVRWDHPAGRMPSEARLAALSDEVALKNAWEAQSLINAVAKYGADSRSSGPAIARFLDPKFDEDLRAAAVLALGQIGDRSAIPALVSLGSEFESDWVLAYNAVESLGWLRAAEARPLVLRVAETHWHRGVRNNAGRALSAIDGGAFARPGMSEEEPPHSGVPFSPLRWAGDEAARYCDDPELIPLPKQALAGRIDWPLAGAVDLEPTLDAAAAKEVLDATAGKQVDGEYIAGSPVAYVEVGGGEFAAFNGGEFGGGLYYLPRDGTLRRLVDEPVDAMWLMDGRLYVVAGLAHLVLDNGHLYVIDPAAPRVERVVRLPASTTRISALSERAVVLRTRGGDLAIAADGALRDPSRLASCAE